MTECSPFVFTPIHSCFDGLFGSFVILKWSHFGFSSIFPVEMRFAGVPGTSSDSGNPRNVPAWVTGSVPPMPRRFTRFLWRFLTLFATQLTEPESKIVGMLFCFASRFGFQALYVAVVTLSESLPFLSGGFLLGGSSIFLSKYRAASPPFQ